MKVLVTGGLGVIGSSIARRLTDDGHGVAVIDACEAPRNAWVMEQLERLGVFVFRGRLEQIGQLETFVQQADAVIHAAASTGIPHSVLHPDDDWRSNVDATRALLEALRKHPIPTAVLSSVKPYAVPVNIEQCGGLDELVVLMPDEPYAASKAAQSMLAMAYARSYDLPIVTFRCSNLYGPAPCHGPRHGWLTWFAISAAIGRPIEIQGTGEQSRDMLHSDDVYSACMLALSHAKDMQGHVFNLGGGKDNRVTVGLAAERFREVTGVEIRRAPPRAMDDDHVFVNTSAFHSYTKWRPLVGVEDGARRVLRWALDNREALAELYKGV